MIDLTSVSLDDSLSTQDIVSTLVEQAKLAGFTVVDVDDKRPWGGFVRLDADRAEAFVDQFFGERHGELEALGFDRISPKFLVVAPGQRLSWQRHQRRSELWRYLSGGGGYCKSFKPSEQPVFEAEEGELVELEVGQCHRLLSRGNDYVLVAEVWRHTDPAHLSDEDDNERLQDDYQRT